MATGHGPLPLLIACIIAVVVLAVVGVVIAVVKNTNQKGK